MREHESSDHLVAAHRTLTQSPLTTAEEENDPAAEMMASSNDWFPIVHDSWSVEEVGGYVCRW